MVAIEAIERHLWLNLANIGKKEKNFLDASLLPSGLFNTFVEVVVEKFRAVRAQSAAFRRYIPCHTRSSPKATERAGPSRIGGRTRTFVLPLMLGGSTMLRRGDLRRWLIGNAVTNGLTPLLDNLPDSPPDSFLYMWVVYHDLRVFSSRRSEQSLILWAASPALWFQADSPLS